MLEAFNAEIHVPNVSNFRELEQVLAHLEFLTEPERKDATGRLMNDCEGISIGIKKAIMNVEMARQDELPLEKFVSSIMEDGMLRKL